jgi:hypothetical protein
MTFIWVRLFCMRRMRVEVSWTKVSLAQISAQRHDGGAGPEAGPQQPDAVKLPQPLAVLDVALAPGHVVHITGVDQHDLKAALLEA